MHSSSIRRASRRALLQTGAAAAAAPLLAGWLPSSVAAEPVAAESEKLSTYQIGPHIWVRWGSEVVTSYRAHRSQKYPYMYPLAGPISGLSLTTESGLPWPHHRSLLFACDRVNGGNYWQGELSAGQVLSDGPKVGRTTENSAEIVDTCQWQKPDGPVICKDERTMRVTIVNARLRLIDWDVTWTAVTDLTVEKTNHSLFAIRAAADLTPLGGGTLLNADGATGEKATFGKASRWCAYFGRRAKLAADMVEGIALFDHPKNPWSPCPWFTRDYGFISPTPLNFIEKPWTLPAGQSVSLRYRVVLFGGDPKAAGLEALYNDWTA
jgi:hypothetical protein